MPSAACCPVHNLGKCDAVFTCCDKCPTFFGPSTSAASDGKPKGQPSWVRYWPRGREAKCVCGETDPWKIRYYTTGYRCDEHRPGRKT